MGKRHLIIDGYDSSLSGGQDRVMTGGLDHGFNGQTTNVFHLKLQHNYPQFIKICSRL